MMPIVVVARRPSAYARRIMAGLAAGGRPPALLLSGSRVELLVGPVEKILRVRRQLGLVEAYRYIRRLGEALPPGAPSPSTQELLGTTGCRHVLYDAVNGGAVLCELASLAPCIVVLAGTGVVDRAFLAANHKGHVVNGHPAILPGVRGVDVVEWALAEDRPLGVCAHLVDASVDAGDLLLVSRFEIKAQDHSLEILKSRIIDRQADAVVAATLALASGEARPQRHDLARSVLRLTAPAQIHTLARQRLAGRVMALSATRTVSADDEA
ncbi:formyltransferase family protein [Bosea sp. FBZP-16]|uniref:formyltransferase family protein n=1 Tax=Bosea sp. FBZP-16 TaxID=2065382 RepID=UPI000C304462|nr:formyltransferase family protein [Bosea sp. FBZP-16]